MIEEILNKIDANEISFADVISFIKEKYNYTPSAFSNGKLQNKEVENQGSAKVFFFAQFHKVSKENTLKLFVEHYQNVLENPEADNHQNIRQFMIFGWEGIQFKNTVLLPK